MNPGICYLYEYKNNQKLRNVGFMKAALHYNSCILQINVRGIPVQAKDTIKLFVFYEKDSEIIARLIQELPCADKSIYSRISITGTDFSDGKSLEELSGFLLLTDAGQYYAALFENIPFHTEKIKLWKEGPDTGVETENSMPLESVNQEMDNTKSEAVIEAESISDTIPESGIQYGEEIEPAIEQQTELSSEPMTESVPVLESERMVDSEYMSDLKTPPISEHAPDLNPVPEPIPESEYMPPLESATESEPIPGCSAVPADTLNELRNEKPEPKETVRKIQRTDLSILPRRCWNLANNSFLMHGYHNYNHLLLVEEEGHFWLGVPGIYAPREARAAELFGFPQFTQAYTNQLELHEDERDSDEKFGYWCRFIR